MTSIDPRNIGPLLDSFDMTLSSGTIFVECIKCGIRCNLKSDNIGGISDREAITYFHNKGWTVKPTICPKCLKD